MSATVPSYKVSGFTLIEILVAIALLGIIMSFSAAILTSFQVNSRSGQRLTVNQAAAKWMEQASNIWSDTASFGNTLKLPNVISVNNASWALQVCEISDPATTTSPLCGGVVTTGKPSYNAGSTITTAPMVRVTLTYTPNIGQPVVNSVELSKK